MTSIDFPTIGLNEWEGAFQGATSSISIRAETYSSRIGFIKAPIYDSVGSHLNERGTVESELLRQVRTLEWEGKVDQAIDVVFQDINGKLKRGEFDKVNNDLRQVDTRALSIDLMVALLTITKRARLLIPDRAAFYSRVEQRSKDLNAWSEHLLSGLE